jgi:hypothetical protein
MSDICAGSALKGKAVDGGHRGIAFGRTVFEDELEFTGLAKGECAAARFPAGGLRVGRRDEGDHADTEGEQ